MLQENDEEEDNLPAYLKDFDDIMWDEDVDSIEDDDYMDLPTGEFLGDMAYNPERDDGGLGSVKIKDIAVDYDVPIDFLLDVLCRWGAQPPINLEDKLGSLVNGEQAFAIAEALTSIDPAEIHDSYIDETLMELSEQLKLPLSEIFATCGKRRFSLPLGADTRLTVSNYRILLKDLEIEDEDERSNQIKSNMSDSFMSEMFVGNSDVLGDGETKLLRAPKVKPFIV